MIAAKYTVVLKTLLDDPEVKTLIDKAMSTYPIYKPENTPIYSMIPTREELNKKILDYYKYREIGFETVGRFLDELETSLIEIMPYYNQLYKATDILNGVDDPFGNVDITETFEEETRGLSEGSSEGTNRNNTSTIANSESNTEMNDNNKSVKSSTPQDLLDIPAKDIDSVNFADEVNWNENISNSKGTNKDTGTSNSESTSSGESTNRSEGTTSHTLTKKGNQGVNTYAHDLKELRELFLNIEQQIINDIRIRELFMMVY